MNYKITWEIELDADTPLDAAKEALAFIHDDTSMAHCFHVQEKSSDDTNNPIYLVDLDDYDCDAVLVVANYSPLIKG